MLAVWVMFAVGINWGGGGQALFDLGVGDTSKILSGQVWRLFTAPMLHQPTGPGSVSHIVSTLIGLFFLGPSLEQRWGGKRFIAFLYASAIVGFLLHVCLQLAIPAPHDAALQQPWFGALSAVHAVAIAWALSFRGNRVFLMFVLPVSSTVLVVAVVGLAVLRLLAAEQVPEGIVSAFGAMAFAWLCAGSDPSPLRKLWWKLRRPHRGGSLQRDEDEDDEDDDDDEDGADEKGERPRRGEWIH